MAKSMRSKREKRLRSIKREIVVKEPFYQNKEAAKLAAQAAALDAPKLPVRARNSDNATSVMEVATAASTSATAGNNMDVDLTEGDRSMEFLKPRGIIGKKLRKKIKIAKKKNRGKGKIRRKHV